MHFSTRVQTKWLASIKRKKASHYLAAKMSWISFVSLKLRQHLYLRCWKPTSTNQAKKHINNKSVYKWKLTKYQDDRICQIGIRYANVRAISVIFVHYNHTAHKSQSHAHFRFLFTVPLHAATTDLSSWNLAKSASRTWDWQHVYARMC